MFPGRQRRSRARLPHARPGREPVRHRPVRLRLRQHRRLAGPAGQLFALANALVGLATGHTAVAFTNPSMVPPQNIRTTVNSQGREDDDVSWSRRQHLPLVLPLQVPRDPGRHAEQARRDPDAPGECGLHSRNDDPATAPVQVDPVHGFDPAAVTAPANQATFGGGADPFRSFSTVPCPCCRTAQAKRADPEPSPEFD